MEDSLLERVSAAAEEGQTSFAFYLPSLAIRRSA
jgi:hypothetical protein